MAAAVSAQPALLAGLSSQLSEAIATVEMQRSTLEEAMLRLASEAATLDAVASVLMEAAATQVSSYGRGRVRSRSSL